MSHPKEADIAELIRALADAGVEFIVVGGAAAVIHGARAAARSFVSDWPEDMASLLAALGRHAT